MTYCALPLSTFRLLMEKLLEAAGRGIERIPAKNGGGGEEVVKSL